MLWLLTAVGCWEEIHYQPSPEAAPSATPTGAAPAAPPAVATPPLDEIGPVTPHESAVSPSVPIDSQPAPPLVLDAPPLETPPAAEPSTADDAATAAAREPALPATMPAVESPEATPPPSELFGDSQSGEPPTETSPDLAVAPTVPAATAAERLHVWQAASKWGLAAAMYAKQLPVERFEPLRDEADAAAEQIQIDLPPLPIPKTDQTPEQAVVEAFAGERSETIIAAIAERYGAEAGALARLALDSNELLLVYSPKRENVAALAGEFTAAAAASGLPNELWSPLAELLDQRAEFVTVRGEVFNLQRRVEEALAAR